MSGYSWQNNELILDVHLQPKASRDEIAGWFGARLKIRITAPPVDGQANAALLRFLAKQFGVAKSDVILVSGHHGRDKRLCIRAPRKLPPIVQPAPGEPSHAR